MPYGFITKQKTDKRGRTAAASASRMKNLIQGIPPLAWDIHFEKLDFEVLDAEEVFLKPMLIDDYPADVWKRITNRAAVETLPGGVITLTNAISVARMSIGWQECVDNIPMRMLSHYINWHGDEDPFIIAQGLTKVARITKDSVAAVRVLILTQASLWYASLRGDGAGITDDHWIECLSYLLYDPLTNTKKFRGMTGLLLQAVGAIAKVGTGIFPHYNAVPENDPFPVYAGHRLIPLEVNDASFYSMFQDQLQSDINDLVAARLVNTAKMLSGHLVATPTRTVLKEILFIKCVGFLSGFSHGQRHLSHFNQLHPELPENEALPGEHPWRTAIENRFERYIYEAHERGLIPSEEIWKATYPTSLRATASGGDHIEISVKVDNRRGGVRDMTSTPKSQNKNVKRSRVGDDQYINIRGTDKKIVGLSNPGKYFDPTLPYYTQSNPGVIGSRSVPGGKPERAIINIHLGEFNYVRILGDAMNFLVNEIRPEDESVQGTPNNFVAGAEAGPKFLDDFWSVYGTSRSDIVNGGADYTAFDATERFENTRRYDRNGMVRALRALNLDKPYGGFPNGLVGITERLLGEGIAVNGIFVSGRVPPGFFDEHFPGIHPNTIDVDEINEVASKMKLKFRMFKIDALRSGELVTLGANSWHNAANFEVWLLVYRPDYMSLKRLRIQGDDSETQWKLQPGETFTKSRIMEYINTMKDVTGQNGLLIKQEKFTLRNNYAEFLQVTWWLGINLPKPIIQIFATEKITQGETSMQKARSYQGKLASIISRGFNPSLANRVLFWTFAWMRSVLVPRSFTMKETYFYPQTALYVTKKNGGVGALPWTTMGANVDSVLVHWYTNLDTDQQHVMDIASGIVSIPLFSIRRELARTINSDSANVFPRDPMSAGRQYVRASMPHSRYKSAEAAETNLKELGIPVTSPYTNLPHSIIDDALQSNPSLRAADLKAKLDSTNLILKNIKTGVTGDFAKGLKWATRFRLSLDDELSDIIDPRITPYSSLSSDVERIFIKYGLINSHAVMKLRPALILRILRTDPFFPRTVRDETVIEALSDPRVFMSPVIMENVLVAIGSRPDLAARVVHLFRSRAHQFVFRAATSGISIGDATIVNCDLSRTSHNRVVKPFTDIGSQMNDIITMHAMAVSIMYSQRDGIPRMANVDIGRFTRHNMSKDLLGRFEPAVNQFLSFYPEKVWEE
jgi:hypothetical protein